MAFRTSPSSSSSLFSAPKWSYDVFLSFRGEDTRNTFVAHLYSALKHQGIHTYIDEKDLDRGETISPTLLKAIEESMISIIVLSSNYASSSWCLEELTQILECKKTKQQIVLPVFYHVDPSEVRKQEGSFGKALAKHQERFKEDPKVQRWKEALQEVGSLAGEHLEDGINENEFMEKIIQWVNSKIVKYTYQLDIAKYPIGLESRLKDLNTDLGIGRNDITLMIGIYGIGGVGKTTIAKAIFNSIGNQFEARCFLANVREKSSREDGLVNLQRQLLDDLLGNFESFYIGSVGAGTNVIKHRLCSKRILLILDDVNESCQLQGLAGDKNWFGPGSRIVITTRDQRLLTCHNQVDSTYEVQGLDDNQAIQLFSWHAFKRDRPVESYVELTKRIIDYAKGLPLALTVLGSALYDRNIEQWKSALEKYERSPHKDIYEILKISYDGLDDNEKDIFLHIACFFKGNSVEYVTKKLDNCHFSSSIGIAGLKDKCLITYKNKNMFHSGIRDQCVVMHGLLQETGKEIVRQESLKEAGERSRLRFHNEIRNQCVEMHDLLQEMGKEIVRQESPKEAGGRSRLWFHKDVRHVLEENTGTIKIEAMLLDFPRGHNEIRLDPKAFKKMRHLGLFINKNAQFSSGPKYLPNSIRVLDWDHYPSSSLPSNFYGDNLVEFRMHHSLIKELGGLNFKNLTNMELVHCEFLTKISDLSSCSKLEKLRLSSCKNLVEVHHSVGLLDKLLIFSLWGCDKLRILPKIFKLRSLREFDFTECSSLEDFPEIECEMEFLDELYFHGTSIKELPSSIENLKGLKGICMYCSIIELPSSIVNLPWLESLEVQGCIDQLGSIRIVKVDGYSQPINIGKVEEEDRIQSTSSIVSTSEYEIATNSSIFNDAGSSSSVIWKSLGVLALEYCCLSESNFFTYINYFPNLMTLDLSGSDVVFFPPHQGVRFPSLDDLYLNECKKLKAISPLPSSVGWVEARGCTSLERFELLSNARYIELFGCHKLLAISSWEEGLQSLISSWEEGFQSLAYTPFYRPKNISIIFPGTRIPSWFSYRMEAHDSNPCEIDINPPHHWNGIDEILVIYVVFGLRSVGIIGWNNNYKISLKTNDSIFMSLLEVKGKYDPTDFSDHVWMAGMTTAREQVDVSRFRLQVDDSRFSFECKSERVVFKRVGIHFLKKHEVIVRDDIGDHIERGYPFSYSNSDEARSDEKRHSSISELENDDENPNEDLELEKDDGNPKEIFGKMRRDDEYDCNMEPNRCPQQKRQHSSTMGITITELENEDQYPKEDMNLELTLGLKLKSAIFNFLCCLLPS